MLGLLVLGGRSRPRESHGGSLEAALYLLLFWQNHALARVPAEIYLLFMQNCTVITLLPLPFTQSCIKVQKQLKGTTLHVLASSCSYGISGRQDVQIFPVYYI